MKSYKSPFKDVGLLISEVKGFLQKYNSSLYSYAQKINQFFEMSAYNSIVEFYFRNKYHVKIQNLFDNKFKYKLSATGYPHNFSFFVVEKEYVLKETRKTFRFEIHHNIAVESAHEKGCFVTPDISIISRDSIRELNDSRYFFSGSRKYYYVENNNLQSFYEVKHLVPFPELLFNFTGLLNELLPDVSSINIETSNPKRFAKPKHLAPSLMLSGSGNFHTRKIKQSLMKRYKINIFDGLFYRPTQPYSLRYASQFQKIGTIK